MIAISFKDEYNTLQGVPDNLYREEAGPASFISKNDI